MRALLPFLLLPDILHAQVLTGPAAYTDWQSDTPGLTRHLQPSDLPPPFATRSSSNGPSIVDRPPGAIPHVPPGFTVQLFAAGLENPRLIRTAPNGDIFLAESAAGRVRILRAPDGAPRPATNEVFAAGLDYPFGIAFYPPGPQPRFVYVATLNQILRFPYHPDDLHAAARPDIIVPRLTDGGGGHVTRDIQFSPDGTRMYVSIGSASNDAESLPRKGPDAIAAFEAQHGLGAIWGSETNRADVLVFTPEGQAPATYATGLRNCVGMAVQPDGTLWCSTNERDGLGNNLPPDYVTRVRQGAFYGWPWYYIGPHEDPRHPNERPDLAARTTTPDILIQPHSAPLQMTFYTPGLPSSATFPPDYTGDAFVALHGSWNRAKRTGYKVVRIHLTNGVPSGEYQDFLTGFVRDDDSVWGRPVGVTTARDGALLVTEDANGTIWRIAYDGPRHLK